MIGNYIAELKEQLKLNLNFLLNSPEGEKDEELTERLFIVNQCITITMFLFMMGEQLPDLFTQGLFH